MAGGVLKSFGGLFLIVGIVALLGGAGAAVYGFIDDKDNREKAGLLGPDPRRVDADQQFMLYGGIAAGAGVVLAIVGGILLAAGGGRANRAVVKAMGTRAAAKEEPTVTSAPDPVPSGSRRGLVVGIVVVVMLVGAVALGIAFLGGGGTPGRGPAGTDDRSRGTEDTPLGTQASDGSVAAGPTLMGGSRLVGDGATEPFDAPVGTTRVELVADWTPGTGCCARLQIYLEQSAGSEWTTAGDETVTPGQSWNVTVDAGKGLSFRFRAFPGEDGVSAGQDYHVDVVFWAE